MFGWSILSGDHRTYHRKHGTDDSDFKTRWRKWDKYSPVGVDIPTDVAAIQAWIDQHADEEIRIPL